MNLCTNSNAILTPPVPDKHYNAATLFSLSPLNSPYTNLTAESING